MASEYLTEEEAEKIKKEILQFLRNHNLNSGLAKVVLTDTIETIEKYSQLPEQLFKVFDDSLNLERNTMNNTAQKVTRIDKDAWDIATELANEYGVSICHIISESVRYCAENAEFKEMDVVVKRLVVGSKVLEQEGGDERKETK